MNGFVGNIEEVTLKNTTFRTVLYTGHHEQLVVMSIPPEGEIGLETHEIVDQFLRVEAGTGVVILNGEKTEIKDGFAIVVPAGVEHNVVNTSKTDDLKLYTVYAPPHHKDKTIHETKADADKDTLDHI